MSRKRIVIILVVVAAALAGMAFSAGWFRHDSALQGSGTAEILNQYVLRAVK